MTRFHEAPAEGGEIKARQMSNFELLRNCGWSALTPLEDMPARLDDRIAQINEYPRSRVMNADEKERTDASSDMAVVAAAYFSLELATGLMPFPQLVSYKQGGGGERDAAKHAESAAVARELIAASKLNSVLGADRHTSGDDLQTLHRNARMFTQEQDETNAALSILRRMAQPNAVRPVLNRDITRDAVHILRMLIAKDMGKISDYSDLLKPIFPDDEMMHAAAE